jgi:hypothetical protein
VNLLGYANVLLLWAKVEMRSPAMSSLRGLVAGARPHQRVVILLQMLGRVEQAAVAVERA